MGMEIKNTNLSSIDESTSSEIEKIAIQEEWSYCLHALDYSLNSPESILTPEGVRTILEIAKRKLENLMEYYEDNFIKEIETRV